MKSTDRVISRATKLSDVLGGMGFVLKQSDSLSIISKLEIDSDWNTNASDIGEEQLIAEQLLDEMLAAKAELNYKKFIKHMDKDVITKFTEKRFTRAMRDLREDLGLYISRKYLGKVNGGHFSNPVETHPGKVRHTWRGVFENQEAFISVCIYTSNGVPYVSGINFR